MFSIPGVDYAWSHPGGAALEAAGKKFACRYLSTDSKKNLTLTEAEDLAAHGVSCVVVWESTASRALSGHAAGAADAKAAAAQAHAAGMPDGRPIFFAVDFDATAGQQAKIDAYFDGAASVLGVARVGIYGGYHTVKRTLDAGKARWAWQTIAWSGGHWDPRAVIRQGAQHKINGVTCDLNTATAADYGQWTPGHAPTPPPPPKPTVPVVDLSNLIAAARTDPGAAQGHTTHPGDVRLVEAALKAEKLLPASYASDGSFGSRTVSAYAAWQRHLGYTGPDANGIPGRASLTKLGAKHGFRVAN